MKKFISFIIKFIVFVLILVGINRILEYILVEDYEDEFRAHMHEMYNQENIDTLFLGSSHVFSSTDPRILEEMWGEDVFLASSSVQKPDVSYYLLKEATKHYDLDRVFLDMYYFQFREEDSAERNNELLKYIYAVSDYMNPSFDKISFILDAVPRENWLRAFLPAIRYSDKLFDLEYIDTVVKAKKSDNYRNYSVGNSYKGFFGISTTEETANDDRYWLQLADDLGYELVCEENIKAYSRKYLDKIISLCKEKNIELVLYCVPMTDYHLAVLGNYDQYTNYVKELAKDNDIEFYDFNMLSPEYASFDDRMFGDTHHTNYDGAEYFTQKLGELINRKKQGEDIDKYFCNSVEDKLNLEEKRILGFLLKHLDNNEFSVEALANYEATGFEYQVQVASFKDDMVDGEQLQILDYGEGDKFALPSNGNYEIVINARDEDGVCYQSRAYYYNEKD